MDEKDSYLGILEELQDHAEKTYSEELISVLLAKDTRQHYSITIDTMNLFGSSLTFAHLLFECPQKALKLLDKAFLKAALNICSVQNLKSDVVTKGNIHVRLTALPNLPEIYRANLPNCSDVGQFMCITGTVLRATASKVLEFRKMWRCKKCKYNFVIDAELEKGYIFEKPSICPNPDWCNGKNFALLSTDVDPEYCKDYREVKIQQQFNTLMVGSVPRSIWVILEDDLVETCHPGNDVNVSGVLIQRWKPLSKGSFIDIDLVLFAHNVEVKNKLSSGIMSQNSVNEFGRFWMDHQKDPLKGRDFILSTICPQVFGLYIVKLAVALILAGGVEKRDGNSRIRGDSHLLLVGDPGTGKSQFLKFASKVCTRAVLTSGIGTTNAGLTVSAVKEGGKWQLEAGALVLADGGVCCIDEFSCIKEHDKTCIHEAMEQQTISVAKAGLVCSLSTKCSILAATNPKGKYDENLSLSENIALASPLLSRFDIILVLLDTYDENWDKLVSSYILEGCKSSNQVSKESSWPITKVRNYFSLVRNIYPKVTASCDKVLQAYYKRQRCSEGRNFARTTPRLLQSLVRLAEGHARLMFRSEVLVIDAIMAIILMESSMSGSAILDELTTLHTSFPEDPTTDFSNKAKTILKLLKLEELVEESEEYRFSYQDLSVKSLLLKVSVLCDTTKNSYLGDSFGFNDNDSTDELTKKQTEESSSKSISLDDVDNFKKPLPIEDEFYAINEQNCDDLPTDFLNEMEDCALPKTLKQSVKGNECIIMENPTILNNEDNVCNEITSLSDLRNTFCDDTLQPQSTNLALPIDEFEHKRKIEEELFADIDANLFQDINSEMDSDSLNNYHISLQPQAKKISAAKSSEMKSFKRFSFQRSKKEKVSLVNNESLNYNHENFIKETEASKVPPNSNFSKYFDVDAMFDPKENDTSFDIKNNCTKPKYRKEAISEHRTNKKIPEGIKNHEVASCSSVKLLSIENRKANDLQESVVINKSSIAQVKEKGNSTDVGTSIKLPVKDDKTESNKFVNAFKKFAFKSRPTKNIQKTNQPETLKPTEHVLQSACTSSKALSETTKSINIQSSQSTFKRIFSSSLAGIDDLDLDDPVFKI